MLTEPLPGGLVFRTNTRDFAPKLRRVVHLAEVHEFVEDDVVGNMRRRLYEPPV